MHWPVPKNSVGSPQIKKNAVKVGDIARNAVRVGKLAPAERHHHESHPQQRGDRRKGE
jgi:hypothetical protein